MGTDQNSSKDDILNFYKQEENNRKKWGFSEILIELIEVVLLYKFMLWNYLISLRSLARA